MPSFARELEQTLHNALGEASKRRHEYATLEHLLIALIDDEHASKVMSACGVNRDELRATVKQYLDAELGALVADSGTDPSPDQRLPARRPARHPPRPVVGPRRSDRRQCAGRVVLRARKLCGLFPPAAGHEPPRCGDLYQPRRRQGRGPGRAARSQRRRGQERDKTEGKSKESALKQFTVNLNEKAKAGKVDPLIGRMAEVDRTVQILCRRSKNNPLYVGDPGVGKTAIAEGWRARSSRATFPTS